MINDQCLICFLMLKIMLPMEGVGCKTCVRWPSVFFSAKELFVGLNVIY